MIESFKEFLHAALPFSGLVTFALGLYFGNKYAIGRDKRKEFNDIAVPLRVGLIKQIDSIKSGGYLDPKIGRDKILHLSDMLNKRKAKELMKAYELYCDAISWEGLCAVNEWGKVTIKDTSKALSTSELLLQNISRK
ncbi:hypothetical protein [Serratia quinivorans]|uniref:hypothetical protein n=1 Tax=Serratia quinivorans TaxID=137545 RepID=UPI003F9E701A